jgi:hypothetical protein
MNTINKSFAAGAFALLCVPAACGTLPTVEPAVKPPCDGTYVLVYEDQETGCDLTPPQRLDVMTEDTDGFATRCANMGGTLTDDIGDAWRCEGIDY